MVMVTGAAARCWKNAFHAFGSAIFFGGRTQTPRMDFTTSVLAGSGSARHGTVCPPPKPKILATPLPWHAISRSSEACCELLYSVTTTNACNMSTGRIHGP